MTGKSRKQLVVLGVLIGLFIAVTLVVSREEGPAGYTAAPSNQPGRGAPNAGVPAVADVNLEALAAEHAPPADPERNLFAFRERAAAPPAARPSARRSQSAVPIVPSGPPPPPPIPLKFIGLLERGPGGGGRVALFSDGQGGTFYAREGEVVDGRYKVIRVGTDSTELSYVDGRGRQTLRLSGQ